MGGRGVGAALAIFLSLAALPGTCVGISLRSAHRSAAAPVQLSKEEQLSKDMSEGMNLKLQIDALENVTASFNLDAEDLQSQLRGVFADRSKAIADYAEQAQPAMHAEVEVLKAKQEKLHAECNAQYLEQTAKFKQQIAGALTKFHAQKALLAHTSGVAHAQPAPTAEPPQRYEVLEENDKLRKKLKISKADSAAAQNRVNALKADLAKAKQSGATMGVRIEASKVTYADVKAVYEAAVKKSEYQCAVKDDMGMDGFAVKVQKVLDSADKEMHTKKMAEQRRIEAEMRRVWWSSSSIRFSAGGDWTEASCGPGLVVTGGGCDASDGSHKFEYNGPAGRSAWKCGGHGGSRTVGPFWNRRTEHYGHKRVWAICAPDNGPVKVTKKEVSGGDWTTARCDAGQVVTGGGCQAAGGSHVFEYNGPDGSTGWKCGGHGGPKKVWAICAVNEDDMLTVKEIRGGDWTMASCDPGQRVTGGGCQADGDPHLMQYSAPEGHLDAWKCGGHGGTKKHWNPQGWRIFNTREVVYGHKKVWAICTKKI